MIEIEGVDDASATAFRAFIRALHLHRRLMLQALDGKDVHPGQALCLRHLACENGLVQKDLAETMFLSAPTVSRMLKSMEEAGLIERRPDTDDQRLTRVYLTAAGRRLEERVRAVTAEHVCETFGALQEADRRELGRLLDELCAGLEQTLERRGCGEGGA